jgi:crossover junction endodeoxyribonuclease RuvC
VLGLDGSTVATGWGIIDEFPPSIGRTGRGPAKQSAIELVGYGVLEAPKSKHRLDRLVIMAAKLRELIKEYSPTEVAIEEAFYFQNPRVVSSLAEVRGVLMLVACEAGLAVCEYAPRVIKQRTAGSGAASKQAVAEGVRMILKLDNAERSLDATDALACAICHQSETSSVLGNQTGSLRKGAFRSNRRKGTRPAKVPAHWKVVQER